MNKQNKVYECVKARSGIFTEGKIYNSGIEGFVINNNGNYVELSSASSTFREITSCPIIEAVNALEGDIYCSLNFRFNQDIKSWDVKDRYIRVGADVIYNDKHICTVKEFNDLVTECEINFGKSLCSYQQYKQVWEEAKQKPVYTQEFAVRGGSNVPLIFEPCEVVYSGSKYTVLKDKNGREYSRRTSKLIIRDIVQQPELIDGECYQFDFDGVILNGVYRKFNNSFYGYDGDIIADNCTNIVKLVPEVK